MSVFCGDKNIYNFENVCEIFTKNEFYKKYANNYMETLRKMNFIPS